MRISGLLDPPTDYQRYSDDCDVSSAVGKPVKWDGRVVGTVTRAWCENGGFYAEFDVTDGRAEGLFR